ncbi:MAG: T9SS type A sorting domain-containing protein, partial [Bacteroidota bacterium]
MAIQKDGKILVGGFLQEGIPFDVLLVRCNADGQIDSTFGVDGRVVTDLGERREYINALAITANGSILAAGRSSEDLGRGFLLMKYTPTGELDQSFGNDGVVVTAFDSIAGQANNMALLEDGKIILSGFFRNNSVLETAVIRYLADGTLDPDFGTNGIVRAVPGNGFEGIPFDMKLQKDGKILLVGEHRISENSPGNFALLRLLPNGTPDTDFGINGVVNTSFDDVDDARALAVALQADGSIVAIGITFLSGEGSFAAARYLNELAVNTADISGTSSALLVYPNPVRQSTTLKYTLEKEEIVSINLLDKEGRLLKNFQQGKQQPAGTYHKVLSFPEELAAGTYILQLSTSTGQIGIQLLHVKAE